MPSTIKFGSVRVNCEGYNYPNDSYVLVGSCGLKYTLEYSEKVNTRPATTTTTRVYTTYDYSQELSDAFVLFCLVIAVWFTFSCIVAIFRRPQNVVVHPAHGHIHSHPVHTTVHVPTSSSSFVDGYLVGSTLGRTPTPTTHVHTTHHVDNSSDDHISTGYGETERR